MKEMKEYFDDEATEHDNLFVVKMGMEEFYDEIERVLNLCKYHDSVLVLGCGSGLEIERIKFPCNVLGVDISDKMLDVLNKKKLYDGVNLKTLCSSFLDLDFGKNKYDIVLSCYAMHHFNSEQKQEIYNKIYSCLKDEGVFINGDTIAHNKDEEDKLMLEALRTYKRENMPFASMHVDVPFCIEYEKQVLKNVGFDKIDIVKEWTNTKLYKCTKTCEGKDLKIYLSETELLNYSCDLIENLIKTREWNDLDEFNKIKEIYSFVRDEILFGYNIRDDITAEQVLKDGYGQCNTKGTLFMALLRAVKIPCRIHAFTINKELQKGAMTGFVYKNAPQNVLHSWVEVFCDNNWYELEAFILDKKYLEKLQEIFKDCNGAFCGYGVAVKDFKNPVIDWNANNTYIQSEGINKDFGVYDSPDEMYKKHKQEMSKIKELLYKNLGRHLMNKNVNKIRKTKI